ncbi:TPA: hypothetical protein OUJ00_004540 [Escherichia coli]|nr:hypothetical protein [Escherichia coli]
MEHLLDVKSLIKIMVVFSFRVLNTEVQQLTKWRRLLNSMERLKKWLNSNNEKDCKRMLFFSVAGSFLLTSPAMAGYATPYGDISSTLTQAIAGMSIDSNGDFISVPSKATGDIYGYNLDCSSTDTKTTYTTIMWISKKIIINDNSYILTTSDISFKNNSETMDDGDYLRITYTGNTINNYITCISINSAYGGNNMSSTNTPAFNIRVPSFSLQAGKNTFTMKVGAFFLERRPSYTVLLSNVQSKISWQQANISYNYTAPGCSFQENSVTISHGDLTAASVSGHTARKSVTAHCINPTALTVGFLPVNSWSDNVSGRISLGNGIYSQLSFDESGTITTTNQNEALTHSFTIKSVLSGTAVDAGEISGNAIMTYSYP